MKKSISPTVPRVRWWRSLKGRERIDGYAFMSLSLFIVGVFVFLALGLAFYLSLTDYTGFAPPRFIGLKNYLDIFRDSIALKSFANTLQFVVMTVVANVVLALAIALLLNRVFPGIRFVRAAYLVPVVATGVVTISIFKMLYAFPYGVFNQILSWVGLEPIGWYTDKRYALFSVVLLTLWHRLPFLGMIFLAAMQDVPQDLMGAAKVDGANAWQRFLHVTLPHLWPMITFVAVISTIEGFRYLLGPLVLTGGGPQNATRTIALYIYNNAFQYHQMGYAGAISFILLLIILGFASIQLRLMRRR
jgi:ABC-type sugar transport system permease subunit